MITVSDDHRANLFTLATFLADNADDLNFNMRTFSRISGVETYDVRKAPQDVEHACGTVGCAIGWGPAAGLEPPAGMTDWWAYARHFFGACDEPGTDGQKVWNAFFASEWATIDNTAEGAAQRIRHFLTTGELPSWRDAESVTPEWEEDEE